MLNLEERQELIYLINKRGMDPELLALELNISEEEMKEYIKEANAIKEKENQISTDIKTEKKSKRRKKVKEIFSNFQQVEFKSALEGSSQDKKDGILILKRGGK